MNLKIKIHFQILNNFLNSLQLKHAMEIKEKKENLKKKIIFVINKILLFLLTYIDSCFKKNNHIIISSRYN